jgi:hypothetical protein
MNVTPLSMWTIYDHPKDFPNTFVARRFETSAAGSRPTADIMISPTLDDLRDQLSARGLTAIHRSPEDDPKIVETWL